MSADLALPIEILGGALVRDEDGVALSSRNAYLTPEQRLRARSLSASLRALRAAFDQGERDVPTLLQLARAQLQVDRLDYLEIVDAASLAPLSVVDRPARALIAAWVGSPRLLDNIALNNSALDPTALDG